jgi:hypothetical protein
VVQDIVLIVQQRQQYPGGVTEYLPAAQMLDGVEAVAITVHAVPAQTSVIMA